MRHIYKITLCIITFSLFASCTRPLSYNEVQGLEAFSNIYGISRWFVPYTENSNVDWNKFAINGIASVRECKTRKELIDTLNVIYGTVIPYFYIDKDSAGKKLMKLEKSYDFTNSVRWQHLGGELSAQSTLYHSKLTNVPSSNLNVGRAALNYYFNPYWVDSDSLKLSITAHKENASSNFSAYAILDFDDESEENHYINLLRRGKQVNLDLKEVDSTFELRYVIDRNNPSLNVDWAIYPDGTGTLVVTDIKLTDASGNDVVPIDFASGVGYWGNPNLYDYEYSGNSITITEKEHLWKEDGNLDKHINIKIPGTSYFAHIPIELPVDVSFDKLPAKSSHSADDCKNYRLADFIVAYNALYYFSPLFGENVTDTRGILLSGIQSILEGDDTRGPIESLLGVLNDGHVQFSTFGTEKYRQNEIHGVFPAIVQDIEDHFIVIHSFVDELKPGDEIISINNDASIDAIKSGCISGSPQLKNAYLERFSFPVDETFSCHVERKGKNIDTTIYGIDIKDYYDLLHNYYNRTQSGLIEDGIYYINLCDITIQEIEKIISNRKEKDIVIYDARHGQSNILLSEIMPYLRKKSDIKYAESWKPRISTPRLCIPPDKTNADAQMSSSVSMSDIVLIGPQNLSSSEDFLDLLKFYGDAYLVGQPTAGISGSTNCIILPTDSQIWFTGERAYSLSGFTEDFIYSGVSPHLIVSPSVDDIIKGTDYQYKAVLELIRGKDMIADL